MAGTAFLIEAASVEAEPAAGSEPVDAAWHVSLQHTEPYRATCQQIAGEFVHHVPILTEGMADGSSMEYTRQALKATDYYIDPEFWDGEAKSCCPPNPGI